MGWALAAAYAASTVFSIASQRKASKAQAAAAVADAQAKREQAFELLDRVEVNIEDIKEKGLKLMGAQTGAFIKGGVVSTEGTPLDVLDESFSKIQREEMIQRREAEFKAEQLFAGADIDTRLSGDIVSAGKMQQAATLLGGGANVIKAIG